MKTNKAKSPAIDIGISAKDRDKISKGLSALLADSYTLYLMTHNFHWNVTGPDFNSLHLMFMSQYTEQWAALDLIAERIRALGHPAPGTYREFVKRASIKEVEGVPKATDMVRHLVAAQEATARTARDLFPLASAANDQPTADLLTQRLDVHEKTAWMLRSLLERSAMKTVAVGTILVAMALTACTQEQQNKFGRGIQNWTGTDGVLDVYTGEKLAMRFIKIDKMSTGIGTSDDEARSFRYGYGVVDENFNWVKDPGEQKVYFEVSDYSTSYVFYESYKD